MKTNTTAFTQQVYAAARRIPRGRVTTYAQLARAIGHPHAARAVGQALHRNPTPGPVPCHRVVSSSGDIGGYVYGRRKKRQLLESEGVTINQRGQVASEVNRYRIPYSKFRIPNS